MTAISAKRVTGEIVRLIPQKGYGFARLPDRREFFVHRMNFTDGPDEFDRLRVGDTISFYEGDTDKGPRALDIEVA